VYWPLSKLCQQFFQSFWRPIQKKLDSPGREFFLDDFAFPRIEKKRSLQSRGLLMCATNIYNNARQKISPSPIEELCDEVC
jgi:hypothetical protein